MAVEICKNIAEYMNSRSTTRQFNKYQVNAISWAIRVEHERRKASGIQLNPRKKADKLILNQRIADIANERIVSDKPITAEDVHLYKRCWAFEYMDRTGKCAWGFASVRERLGYDPATGRELLV